MTTSIAPANDKVFINALGTIADMPYAGSTVASVAMNRGHLILSCNPKVYDSVSPSPTPIIDVRIVKIESHQIITCNLENLKMTDNS